MSILDSLPQPEAVADQIKSARRERSLLRRLYQLSVEARDIREKQSDEENTSLSREVTRG